MTKRKAPTRRKQERIPFWRTVGLVIVILVATAVFGLASATVLVTLDGVAR